ncbi:MAG: cytochrome d ubiquinol oxidase subunit II [Candidatus Nanopelagicales bacterium]|jgi:cytochrome d ubiquinol oxidase subunit II|nr:cytochrome d ubiquinol oxidase subunit II [Candidatus Nanopelagicales bacterium]
MELTTVWFILIAVLWIGYFVLEGFDFGVGMLLPVVGKNEAERRAVVTTLGPVWDGNEVWVLVAGGATFAAFPEWYATLFSGFYLPLFLILVALIVRGVAFEYRSKRSDGSWRARWDAAIVFGSALPALLWGVAFSNIVRGVPLEEFEGSIEYAGGFFNLLNPFALLGGLTFVAIFLTHGAIFLSLKTTGEIRERAYAVGLRTGAAATVLAVAFLLWAQLAFSDKAWTWVPVLLAAVAWLVALAMHRARKEGLAFTASAVTIGLAVVALFGMLFPNVMPNIDAAGPSLTTDNASSTDYTLTIMTWVAVVFTPIVLAYQSWTYWVFRKRVGAEHIADAEVGSLDEVPV